MITEQSWFNYLASSGNRGFWTQHHHLYTSIPLSTFLVNFFPVELFPRLHAEVNFAVSKASLDTRYDLSAIDLLS